jgi:hypothetical protein
MGGGASKMEWLPVQLSIFRWAAITEAAGERYNSAHCDSSGI